MENNMDNKDIRIASQYHPCSIEYLPSSFLIEYPPQEQQAQQQEQQERPQERPREEVFAVGEYQLDEITRSRQGFIRLYDAANGECINNTACESGILDMKVINNALGAVMSSGKISLYQLGETSLLETISEENIDEGFFLSLSSDGIASFGISERVAVSTEKGSVIVYAYGPTGLQEQSIIQNAHMLLGEQVPAWYTTFSKNQEHSSMILSGGDDNMARLWDIRVDHCSGISSAIAQLKCHSGGVTSGSWNPRQPHALAVGSYDGNISMWDTRSTRKPLFTFDAGGGVWRLKWYPISLDGADSTIIAAACMHGGTSVLKVDSGGEVAGIPLSLDLATHHMHKTEVCDESMPLDVTESMGSAVKSQPSELSYGVDIIGHGMIVRRSDDLATSEWSVRVASCSFYQDVVHIWDARISCP